MLYTDRVKDAIAVLKTDLEEMNDLSSDPEMDRAISDLKVHLDDFLDACVESLVEQEEEEEGGTAPAPGTTTPDPSEGTTTPDPSEGGGGNGGDNGGDDGDDGLDKD